MTKRKKLLTFIFPLIIFLSLFVFEKKAIAGSQTKTCSCTSAGCACNMVFSDFLGSGCTLDSATVDVGVYGDFGSSTEYTTITADGRSLGNCGTQECASSYDSCKSNVDVTAEASDDSITIRSDSTSSVNYCSYNNNRAILNWTETCGSPPIISSASESPDPLLVGNDVTFTADWSDSDSSQVKLHVCKTNSITGQTCDGGNWCESSSFTSSDPVTCSYTTQASNEGTNDYYLFVCDDGDICSTVETGSFTVNTDQSFLYRKPITIDNTGNGSTLSDYQIKITTDTAALISAGKMNSDCSDIRFSDNDNYSELNWTTNYSYWIKSGCNSTSTVIWVEVNSIPASSNKTIYMYYSNSGASSVSNKRGTLNFSSAGTYISNFSDSNIASNHGASSDRETNFYISQSGYVNRFNTNWTYQQQYSSLDIYTGICYDDKENRFYGIDWSNKQWSTFTTSFTETSPMDQALGDEPIDCATDSTYLYTNHRNGKICRNKISDNTKECLNMDTLSGFDWGGQGLTYAFGYLFAGTTDSYGTNGNRIYIINIDDWSNPEIVTYWDASGHTLTEVAGLTWKDKYIYQTSRSQDYVNKWQGPVKITSPEPSTNIGAEEIGDGAPSAPTTLKTDGQVNPDTLVNDTPSFTAIYNGTPTNDIANAYRIQIDDNSDFSSPLWDSTATGGSSNIELQPGPTEGIDCQVDACSPDTSIPDSSLRIGKRSTCGGSYPGGPYRSLLKFDLSSIPTGATINSASLEVYIYDYEGSNNFQFYQATSAWDETATWNTLPTYNSGSVLFSLSSSNYRTHTKKTADVTTYIQNWVDGTWDNHGWYIKGSSESDWSRDWFSSSDDGTETYRPKLIVDYDAQGMTNCNQGTICSSIEYDGPSLNRGTTYYWRIKYWDDSGQEGAWSTEDANFKLASGCPTATGTVEYDCTWENNLGSIEINSAMKTLVGAHEISSRKNLATITVPAGKSITIQSDQVVVVGSLDLTGDGSVVIIDGGQIKPGGVLSYEDNDGDGYAANFDLMIKTHDSGDFTPQSNILTTDFTDCDENDSNKWQNLTGYTDNDGDTFTVGGAQQVCSGNSLPAGYTDTASGSDDCNDDNASVWATLTGYVDNDNDGYGTGTGQNLCTNGNLPSGYADNADDIDDNNDCADNSTTHQCGAGDLDGTCTPVSAGENGLAACQRCNGSSIDPVNVTDDTQDTEGSNLCNQECKKCSGGSCVNQTEGEDLFSQCGIYCDGSGACSTCLPLANSCSNNSDCCSGYCSSDGYCCSSSCSNDPCTDYTYYCNPSNPIERCYERTCYTADCSSGTCQQVPYTSDQYCGRSQCRVCNPDDPQNYQNIAAGTDPYDDCTPGSNCVAENCNGSGYCEGYNDGQRHGCQEYYCYGCYDDDQWCEGPEATDIDPFDICNPTSSKPCLSDYCKGGGSSQCGIYQDGEKGLCGQCEYCNDDNQYDCEDVPSHTDPHDECPLEECMKGVCDYDETCEFADYGTDPGGFCQAQNDQYLCYNPGSYYDPPTCQNICDQTTGSLCKTSDTWREITCNGDPVYLLCSGAGTYGWYGMYAPMSTTTMNFNDARNYCDNLNSNSYAGYTNWEIPEDHVYRDLCSSEACQQDPASPDRIMCFDEPWPGEITWSRGDYDSDPQTNTWWITDGEKDCRYHDYANSDLLRYVRCARKTY